MLWSLSGMKTDSSQNAYIRLVYSRFLENTDISLSEFYDKIEDNLNYVDFETAVKGAAIELRNGQK